VSFNRIEKIEAIASARELLELNREGSSDTLEGSLNKKYVKAIEKLIRIAEASLYNKSKGGQRSGCCIPDFCEPDEDNK
jgi:hypothetical protein